MLPGLKGEYPNTNAILNCSTYINSRWVVYHTLLDRTTPLMRLVFEPLELSIIRRLGPPNGIYGLSCGSF